MNRAFALTKLFDSAIGTDCWTVPWAGKDAATQVSATLTKKISAKATEPPKKAAEKKSTPGPWHRECW